MPFQAIAVRQSRNYTLTGQTDTIAIAPSASLAAGSTVLVIGSAFQAGTGLTVLLSSVSGGGTWESALNVRADDVYVPNVFACVVYNVSAATPTITLTVNQSSAVTISLSLIEIEKVPAAAVLDGSARTGTTAASAATTSTAATGTLAQTDNLTVLCAGGWFGAPVTPPGYTAIQSTANGSGTGYVGCGVYHKKVTSTATVTGTVAHDPSGGSSAMLLVFKAASDVALQYKFQLNPSAFTSADTAISGYVWRNSGPDGVLAEAYTGLAGDAVAGDLLITPTPANVQVTDTITGVFYNATDTSGLITGTVI
jgi:hypothetical protein